MTLTVGSLFSGIGGLDLGLERAGMTVRWQSEIHPYACRVLAKHWPDVPNHGDITTIDWSGVEHVDVICGGYPCQPFSLAGVRRGGNDARHLWPHFLDAIRHLRPRYALLENVSGHLSLGFGRVLGDLAEIGYDATWDCIPAAAVGAPHRRDRVFVVARAQSHGEPRVTFDALTRQGVMVPDADRHELRQQPVPISRCSGAPVVADDGATGYVADANIERCHGRAGTCNDHARREQPTNSSAVGDANSAPEDAHAAQSGSRSATGEPGWWAVEPDVGRVAHGVPSRVDRLYGLGNAVVPQVAEHVGRQILAAHLLERAA